jgi:hypothetical protein
MELIIYCVLAAGAYLLVVSIAFQLLENKLRLSESIPAQLVEKPTLGWFIINYVTELLFYVVIPTLAYSLFYVVLPLSGVRAGMAVALVAFTLGAVPLLMGLSMRVRLPMIFLLFALVSFLFKIGGALIIIGYLYSL